MTPTEFNQLVEASGETPNLDFKGDCPWDAQSMAKDFIAMANTRGGGIIVIGIGESLDGSFARIGVSKEHKATYNDDLMRDKLIKYIDPPISFSISFIEDANGLEFVVISIPEFTEVPHIAKADIDRKLRANIMYVRTKYGRAASVPISNASDFKDLVELAALKLIQKRRDLGWSSEPIENPVKKARMESPSPLLATIKSRGYWKVEFSPLAPGNITPLSRCLEVVERSQVRLGWPFPWLPSNRGENESLHPGDKCYEAEIDWRERKEFWRMFQTEEFEFFGALREDWKDRTDQNQRPYRNVPEKALGIVGTVYTMFTQVFEFAAGLHRNGLYARGLKITIALPESRDRELYVDRDNRNDFYEPRITKAGEISINTVLTVEQLLDTRTESSEAVLEFLQYFKFLPGSDQVRNEQEKILLGN